LLRTLPPAQWLAVKAHDVVVIGGGAAGAMCAIEAGKRGRAVLVLDRARSRGKKILISGGGRCNFTNLFAGPDNYISAQPDFCRSALARYTPGDFIQLVEKHGIAYHEKKLGQLFCDGSSRQIVDMLRAEAAAAGVEELDCRVLSVSKDGRFRVATDAGGFPSGRTCCSRMTASAARRSCRYRATGPRGNRSASTCSRMDYQKPC
jgi:predicted Rossmann fold flavoprotein